MKLKGSIMIVALLLAAFAIFHPAVSSPDATMTVEFDNPSYPPVDPPTTFIVNIKVYDVVDLHDWEFFLRWNPYVIAFVDATEGNWAATASPSTTDFSYYISSLGEFVQVYSGLWSNATSVTGTNLTLAQIEFECYASGDPFTLDIYDTGLWKFGLVQIAYTTEDAEFTQTFPVVTFSRVVTTDVSGQRATAQDPAPNDTVRFDARTSYAQPRLIGDINRDGQVTGTDLSLLSGNWFYTPSTPGYYWDADIDRSGQVTGTDLALLSGNWFKSGGYINNFKWDFGDGTIVQGKGKSVVTHVFTDYNNPGYTVNLTVTDGNAKSWSQTTTVKIWRDIAAIDIWPCYDDYLGNFGVMPGDDLPVGTILFPAASYRNIGTLKQTYTVRIFLRNTVTSAEITLFTLTRTNNPPPTRADVSYPPYSPIYTFCGFEVNDPKMGSALLNDTQLMFVDYDESGFYDISYYERPIWDTDASGNVTAGDIDCTAGAVITGSDPDIDMPLTFDGNLKWVDDSTNGAFDIGERVYYDYDDGGTVNAGDYYVWLETAYYGVVYDTMIYNIPTGSYTMVITVTSVQVDLNSANNEFVYNQFDIV